MSPIVQGRKKGGGGHVATEASDTLRSIQVAEILDLVSEGPIQGLVNGLKSVYLDGVALQNADGSSNFENVSFAWTAGTQGQVALDGFNLVQNEIAVGVKVSHAVPIERTVLAGSNVVRITVGVPQLSYQDPANGDMVGNKVEFAIELDSNGGGFVEVYRTTLDGKTMSHYQRSVLVTLTGSAPWTLRMKRITADSTQSNSVNAVYWDSYTEIQTAKLRYPNSAVYGLRVNSQNFSRVPTRGYDILGRVVQVPANYNPLTRAYTGIWDGTFVPAWTNNPAWVFYDLLTHPRYGLGQYVQAAVINKWRLYQIAQYCDELVPDGRSGQEPRFTCNLYLQTQAEAYKVLQDMVAIFRGILLYGNGVVDVVQDAPSDALSLFTPANVIDGKFVYQGASERTRHSGVIVYWNNLANQGKREPELYQEPDLVARYGVRNLELSPLGTWSRGQAVRLAKWALYSEDAESEVVNFGVGSEGALVPLGRVFKIADPAVSGERLGGRIRTATASVVTLDKPVTLVQGEAYTLTVAMADPDDPFNLTHESRTVTSVQADGMELLLAAPFSTAPAAQSIWLLESTAVVATTWRCIGMREVPGENRFEITGVAHSPDKYLRIEQGIYLEPKPISRLKPGAVKPTNLVITESVYTASGAAKSRLTVSWLPGAPGQYYRVSWRYQGGVWAVLPDTSAQNVDLPDMQPGTVDVAVRAVDGLGSVSTPLEGSYNVGGKTSTGGVSALALAITATGVVATWAAPTGADGATWVETELRTGPAFDGGATVFKGRALSHNLGWLHAQAWVVWAVHRDSSGNMSAPISATITIHAPGEAAVASAVDVTVVKLAWGDCKTDQPIAHYVVKRGAAWADGQALGHVNALMTTLLEVSEGQHRFWVGAVDVAGNIGTPGSALVTVGSPISAVLLELNSGLTSSLQGIHDLGVQVGTIDVAVFNPTTGLLADAAAQALLTGQLQHDVTVAHQQITALANSASASTELLAARLGQQQADENQSANSLGSMLQGAKDKKLATTQLALAKTQLQASVDQLGVSTASSLTVLSAQVGQNRADFESEVTLRTTADQTEVTARTALAAKQTTDHGTAMAAVTTEQTARTSAIASEASARQTLAAKQQTDHDTSQAAITNEQTLRVTADQAAASNLTSVQADLNGKYAGIAQKLAVVVDANGNVVAAYTLSLNTNGHIVGMRIDNNGTVGNIVVQGDKFAFVPPGSTTAVPVFVAGVVNGVNTFGINGQLMVDGTIYARSLNVSKLSALTAILGNVTAGTVRMDSDGAGDWGLIASGTKNFDDGVNGFWLGKHPTGQSAVDLKAGTARLKLTSWGDNLLEFPGFRATPSGLTIDQVDVIKTLNIRGGSVIAPLSTTGHPNQSYGASTFALAVASGYQSLAANTYVSATVNARVGATGPCNCRVGAYLYGANGALVTIFDQDTSVASGTAATPAFSGGVLVPYEQYWCVAVWVGNSYTSGSLYVSDITLNAFGGQK